ncbi:MAG: acyl-[acyl-carrier-protein]--UDP-N-acetylglucosamine O-acyltransferase [Isosphaeraceae bacterium]|jgi:UDP-N-acetylglucosamine acyltransferase|nr:MAG: acyl-[acyl-carrier-protein]--UDP-N-acetylglucosamine O-acyltransferase [Isosphaeraceae bacterium]
MAVLIADTAWVDPRASLDDGVEVGPFCIVGPGVRIGAGTRLAGHVCLQGPVVIGQRCSVSPFCVLGGGARDLDRQPRGRVEVGDETTLGEAVVIHRARDEAAATRVGSRTVVHPAVHLAADCWIGDRVSLGSHCVLGAAVHVQDHAVLGPSATIHHDVTVGTSSFVAAQARIFHDVPPYLIVDGQPARVRGVYGVGLKRLGLTKAAATAIHEAYRLLYRARLAPSQAAEVLSSHGHWTPETALMIGFVSAQQAGRHGRARDQASPPREAEREVPA